jgi:hypothetical protein
MANTTKLIEIYERTLQNCLFYEKEDKKEDLLNEIGALRGISYCLEAVGICTHNEQFLRLIDLQQKLKTNLKEEE